MDARTHDPGALLGGGVQRMGVTPCPIRYIFEGCTTVSGESHNNTSSRYVCPCQPQTPLPSFVLTEKFETNKDSATTQRLMTSELRVHLKPIVYPVSQGVSRTHMAIFVCTHLLYARRYAVQSRPKQELSPWKLVLHHVRYALLK